MSKKLKIVISLPLTLISIILMIAGALGLGYSFVTVVINHDYVAKIAQVVENVDDNGQKSVVLEYTVGEETYNGKLPFLESRLGSNLIIEYNPDKPALFHLGDQRFHFSIFVWGLFFEMLGIMIITLNHKFQNN